MATLTTAPERAASGRKVSVALGIDETGANFARVWVTAAPAGSELRKKIDDSRQSRVEVFSGDANSIWENTFDRGGRYTFQVQEYTRGRASYGGGYQYAPDTNPLETPVGTEYTVTVDIGQRMTCPVGAGGDTATLLFWVWGTTIRESTVALHGEASPTIIADSPTPKMAAAMESTAVRAAVTALKNTAVSTALGDISSIVADMVTKLNLHHGIAAGTHALGGGDDTKIPVQYASTMAPKDLPTFVNVALQMLKRHRTNDAGDGTGPGGALYHEPGGDPKADFVSMPIIDAVAGLSDAYAALAEIYRSHQTHLPPSAADPGEYHELPTGPYTESDFELNALPKLLQVHYEVFSVLAAIDPAVPPTQTEGATLLISQAGFSEG